jgi:hypothetical protein
VESLNRQTVVGWCALPTRAGSPARNPLVDKAPSWHAAASHLVFGPPSLSWCGPNRVPIERSVTGFASNASAEYPYLGRHTDCRGKDRTDAAGLVSRPDRNGQQWHRGLPDADEGKELRVRTLSALPPWLMIAIGFVFFAAISAGCRFALSRVASPERGAELEDYAGKLLGVFGATFAFLIGFAVTITWSAVSAGQDAVDLQASSAQQLSWATSAIQDQAGAAGVNGNLRSYLDSVVNKDGPAFADGNFSALPSAETFDTLQNSVHQVASGQGNTDPVASGMVSAAASLTAAQSKVTAVAQRSLPTILIALILLSGSLLAATVGMSALTVKRPYLMYAWALLAAVSLAVVLMMDFPFSGGVTVNLGPLSVAAGSL